MGGLWRNAKFLSSTVSSCYPEAGFPPVPRVCRGVLKSSSASGETAFGQSTGLNHVRIGNIEVATDAAGALTLKFRQSNPAAFIPAWKLLAGEIDESKIAGKIILIGTSTPGLLDLRATPLDAVVPGVLDSGAGH